MLNHAKNMLATSQQHAKSC